MDDSIEIKVEEIRLAAFEVFRENWEGGDLPEKIAELNGDANAAFFLFLKALPENLTKKKSPAF